MEVSNSVTVIREKSIRFSFVEEKSLTRPFGSNDILHKYCLIDMEKLPFYESVYLDALKHQTNKYDELKVPDWMDNINHDSAVTRRAKDKKCKFDLHLTEKTMDSIKLRDRTSKILDKMEYDQRYDGVKSLIERKIERLKHKIEYFDNKFETLTLIYNKQEEKLKHELEKELKLYESILKGKKPKGPSITGDSVDTESVDLNNNAQDTNDIDPREKLILLPKKIQHKIIKSEPYCLTLKHLQDIDKKLSNLEQDLSKYKREYHKLVDSFKVEKLNYLRGSEINMKFRRRQSNLWQCLHPLLDFELNIDEVERALQRANRHLVNDKEFNYISNILDLPGHNRINFKLFCLIASLSEKVSQLDYFLKDLIQKLDFDALEVKIQKAKKLFFLLHDSNESTPNGYITEGALRIELEAGGLVKDEIEVCLKKLTREKGPYINFVEFLLYIPLFVKIHEVILDNPIHLVSQKI